MDLWKQKWLTKIMVWHYICMNWGSFEVFPGYFVLLMMMMMITMLLISKVLMGGRHLPYPIACAKKRRSFGTFYLEVTVRVVIVFGLSRPPWKCLSNSYFQSNIFWGAQATLQSHKAWPLSVGPTAWSKPTLACPSLNKKLRTAQPNPTNLPQRPPPSSR